LDPAIEVKSLAVSASEAETETSSAESFSESATERMADEGFSLISDLEEGGNGQGRRLEGKDNSINGNLINLDSQDGGLRIAGNGHALRPSSSWVSDFVMELGGGVDRKENMGIEITLAPPESQTRPHGRRWR
jgi:hypothetical protein